MPTLKFTQNLQRHIACSEEAVVGGTVREALETYFVSNGDARSYIVDDQGALRHHMMIFVDGKPLQDREQLSDPTTSNTEIFIVQALSGG